METNLPPRGPEQPELNAGSERGGKKDNAQEEDEVNWVIKIEKTLEDAKTPQANQQKKKFRIFGVSPTLKSGKQRWYFQPELIYLGLCNKRFHPTIMSKEGEAFKLTVVSEFLNQVDLKWQTICESVVKNVPKEVQQDHPKTRNRERQEATIRCELALDAIFLTSFLSGYLFEAELHGQDSRYQKLRDIVKNEGLCNEFTVALDVMKLENQIPLKMIGNVLKILYPDDAAEANFMLNELCRRWITRSGPTPPGFSEKLFEEHFGNPFDFGKDCGHLLDCVSRVFRGDGGDSKAGHFNALLDEEDLPGCVKKCFL